MRVAVVMGSVSDLDTLKGTINTLHSFSVSCEVHVLSAHRSPEAITEFAKNAKKNGFGVIIAAAGKAAHLAGVIAAHTTLPVIGIPIKSSLDGLDALLSVVQMPSGIPVATVAIDGTTNAALLAIQILAVSDELLAEKLEKYKADMAEAMVAKDKEISKEYSF